MGLAQSYWSDSGKHQNLYNELEELIPESGKSGDPIIELLRCGSNIYYDCYNNGGGNIKEISSDLDFILDNDEVVSKVDPKVWKRFEETIVAHRDQCFEEETEVECSDCGGTGEIECDECCGSCTLDCEECGGNGECEEGDSCPSCDGSGEIECVFCSGDGQETCECCGGSGQENEPIEADIFDSTEWEGPMESVMDAIILTVSEKLGATNE